MHLADDWAQIGVTRGLLLGPLYPWLMGLLSGFPDGMDAALGSALVYGLFGTLIGLLLGPPAGGLVGLIAVALDDRVSLRATPRGIGALAILTTASALSALFVCVAYATGAAFDDGWAYACLVLVVGPSVLGLVSLIVRPRIERPRATL